MEHQILKGFTNLIFNTVEISKKQFEKLENLSEDISHIPPLNNIKHIKNIYVTFYDRMITVNVFNEFPNWQELLTQIFEILIGEEEVIAMYQNQEGNDMSSYFEKGINSDEITTTVKMKEPNPFLKSKSKNKKL